MLYEIKYVSSKIKNLSFLKIKFKNKTIFYIKEKNYRKW